MAFDLTTAQDVGAPVAKEFDVSTAQDFFGASVIEPLKTVATGFANLAAGGLAGIGTALVAGPEEAERVIESFQRQISQPETEAGKAGLQTLQSTAQSVADAFNLRLSAVGGVIEFLRDEDPKRIVRTILDIQEKGTGVVAGDRVLEETGNPVLATIARIGPEAVFELATLKGVGSAIGATERAAEEAVTSTVPVVRDAFKRVEEIITTPGPTNQRITQLLEEGSTSRQTAGFQLAETPRGPRAVKFPPGQEAIRQGVKRGVVADIQQANAATKAKLRDMVDIREKQLDTEQFALRNRASDVLGESIINRFRVVWDTNRAAGKQIDKQVRSLKGQPADLDIPVAQFIEDLESVGVRFGRDLEPIFDQSIFKRIPVAKRTIKNVIEALKDPIQLDGFGAHLLKREIDELVTFGKTAQGLAGNADNFLKSLRHGIKEQLNATFPEYGKINRVYSETLDAVDALQEVAGNKLDLIGPTASQAAGTSMRRLTSNFASRQRMQNAVDEIDRLAKQHLPALERKNVLTFGNKNLSFDDDIGTQVITVNELDKLFGAEARTSLQGVSESAEQVTRGIISPRAGAADLAIKGIGKVAEKIQGINEENLFKALRDLLKGN